MKGKTPRIIALTEAGKALAERLVALERSPLANALVSYKPQPFGEQVQAYFRQGELLIFICATGIVMRTLAPVLQNKYEDPPVLVMDEQGKFVIPLLSGHEGGANQWAQDVAELINAQPVITTANAYTQPKYCVGMGCERGCPVDELEVLLRDCLTQAGLALSQISALSSIDIKADEVGLIALAERLGLVYQTWDKTQLATMESLLSTRSEYVYKTVGVYGVAESAALFSAQQLVNGVSKKAKTQPATLPELVLNKQKTKKATCAIARIYCGAQG
ncbi:MAG: cobalt-precorrin 5A hydrolase [Pontibacterium sp.]